MQNKYTSFEWAYFDTLLNENFNVKFKKTRQSLSKKHVFHISYKTHLFSKHVCIFRCSKIFQL